MAKRPNQTTVRLSDWEFDQLQALASAEGRKINQVILDSIYEYAFQQYQEAKQFLDSVDNGMLKPSTEDSKRHLDRLYQAFSAKCRATKQLHDQKLLDEEYSEPVDNIEGGE
jgi:predicted transcriptional regulator